jgi:ubiquinone/menaquinone biosynthesis C-methylase UbiE
MTQKITRKAYDTLGKAYYEARKYKSDSSYFYNELLEMPVTLKLLGNVKGKNILDAGAGPGLYARLLTDKGAKVKGIDISPKLLEIARKEAPEVRFTQNSVEKLPFKDKEFDIVLCTLVLGHLDNWNKAFKEIFRVLKSGGLFIFSVYNPIGELAKSKKWFFKRIVKIKDYFIERKRAGTWKSEGKKVMIVHYHKTYGTIVKYIINNGFEILDYEDCKPPKNSKKMFPKDYERTIHIPLFCVWKVRKKTKL